MHFIPNVRFRDPSRFDRLCASIQSKAEDSVTTFGIFAPKLKRIPRQVAFPQPGQLCYTTRVANAYKGPCPNQEKAPCHL